MTSDHLEGLVIAERYRLVELIGVGATGNVYRAEDLLLGSGTVAVKRLEPKENQPSFRDRFEREASICARLAECTLHVVSVQDFGLDQEGMPFVVMEYLQGSSLGEILQFNPLSLHRFLHIARQICLGIQTAHEGINLKDELVPIIHRDLKPSNIYISDSSTLGGLVKILDFGVAQFTTSKNPQGKTYTGTLAYSSPEQIQGWDLTPSSDIYSLGIIFYEMLVGKRPIQPSSQSFEAWQVAHSQQSPLPFPPELEIPAALSKMIGQCLAKCPGDRPQSVADIRQAIEGINVPQSQTHKSTGVPTFPSDRQGTQPYGSTFDPTSLETLSHQLQWPQEKPQRKIVFPGTLRHEQAVYPCLWAMLDPDDLQRHRSGSTRLNQFQFSAYPHPMVQWLTVFYHPKAGPRWLPCYLDLKTQTGVTITAHLAESPCYLLCFFALDQPQSSNWVRPMSISLKQRTQLKKWLEIGCALRGPNQAPQSKKKLKANLEEVKPKILEKLQMVAKETFHG